MKHLNGKKIKIWDNNGNVFIGLCTGATDDIVKIMIENETDERVFFIKNIFSYQIIGEGTAGGYSGLKVYVCKNDTLGCKGRVLLSCKETHINDMGCELCKAKKAFKCDFGCIGAMEVLPSIVQRKLFDGMIVEREKTKNYLQEAINDINKGKNKNE